jgi:hypothetical protein
MGFADLVLFYVVTGISLRWIATAASGGPSAIVIWIGAWLCFYLPLALSVLELSSRYPQEATVKIVGLSSILVVVGAILYYAAARRNRNNQTGV